MPTSRHVVVVILALLTGSAGSSGSSGEPLLSQIVGHWELLSVEILGGAEPVYPFGEDPLGEVVYDPAGHFSGQIMRRGRPTFSSGDIASGTPEEISAAFAGYVAYFGTYEVDESCKAIVHHVVGSLFPNWVGTEQVRQVSIDGTRLTLRTPPFSYHGQDRSFRAEWRRME